MSSIPVASVIVPAYNAELTLSETLDSLVRQTVFSDLEVVVIDDGSTDGTKDIAEKYVRRFPQIHYLRQANSGVSVARNAGMKKLLGNI